MAGQRADGKARFWAEEAALAELEKIRVPLHRELERLRGTAAYRESRDLHLLCTRRHNQMRISPLEALAIARAFRRDPELARRLPAVLNRLERALQGLSDTEERQGFDCPLLEGSRCLVHDLAKPVGCLAWHPNAPEGTRDGSPFTRRGWDAFAKRDRLNDAVCGTGWKLRVIPLWLKRVFAKDLRARARAKVRRARRSG